MFYAIDPSNGVAIYDQIIRQVMFAIAQRALAPGDRIPSVRDLARQLAVNPNTVARAYRELQTRGVVAPLRGSGLEVTAEAPARCADGRRDLLRERLRGVLVEAFRAGLTWDEMANLAGEEWNALQRSEANGKGEHGETSA